MPFWPTFQAGRASALLAAGFAALPLTGCGSSDDGPGPGEVTVGEARALEEAAEMLDEQRLPPKPAETAPAPAAQ